MTPVESELLAASVNRIIRGTMQIWHGNDEELKKRVRESWVGFGIELDEASRDISKTIREMQA